MLFHMLNHDTFLIFYILRAREMVYIKNCIKTLYKKMYWKTFLSMHNIKEFPNYLKGVDV